MKAGVRMTLLSAPLIADVVAKIIAQPVILGCILPREVGTIRSVLATKTVFRPRQSGKTLFADLLIASRAQSVGMVFDALQSFRDQRRHLPVPRHRIERQYAISALLNVVQSLRILFDRNVLPADLPGSEFVILVDQLTPVLLRIHLPPPLVVSIRHA